jgi:hypothetical protein
VRLEHHEEKEAGVVCEMSETQCNEQEVKVTITYNDKGRSG